MPISSSVAGLAVAWTVAAWLGKLIVDAVVAAMESGEAADRQIAYFYVGAEAVTIIALAGALARPPAGLSLLRLLRRGRPVASGHNRVLGLPGQ